MDDPALWIALRNVPGLHRFQAQALLARFGSPEAVFARSAQELAAYCRLGTALALARGPDLAAASAELEQVRELELQVLLPSGTEFPALLREIPDPPLLLYARGRLPPGPTLSIVGPRRPSARGRELARAFAERLAAAGAVIVSGLAYGIDAAAHEGALDAGAATVAILASGLDRPSPIGNRRLAKRILACGGAWLSEYAPGEHALAYRFPERNRLISGLSAASLIVEARERSGSLWTARHATEQNRDVLVLPGPVDSDLCRGSNRLLQDGAIVILDVEDLLDQVFPGVQRGAPQPAPGASLGAEPRRLLHELRDGARDPDQLARTLGIPPSRLAAILLELELAGLILRDGTRIARRRDVG